MQSPTYFPKLKDIGNASTWWCSPTGGLQLHISFICRKKKSSGYNHKHYKELLTSPPAMCARNLSSNSRQSSKAIALVPSALCTICSPSLTNSSCTIWDLPCNLQGLIWTIKVIQILHDFLSILECKPAKISMRWSSTARGILDKYTIFWSWQINFYIDVS